ncbi:hypothetical protein BT69DRAFT_1321799, partial [Atractiella rhizophila]
MSSAGKSLQQLLQRLDVIESNINARFNALDAHINPQTTKVSNLETLQGEQAASVLTAIMRTSEEMKAEMCCLFQLRDSRLEAMEEIVAMLVLKREAKRWNLPSFCVERSEDRADPARDRTYLGRISLRGDEDCEDDRGQPWGVREHRLRHGEGDDGTGAQGNVLGNAPRGDGEI